MEGNVFKSVCLSRGVSVQQGEGSWTETPRGRPLQRAVRIELECVLVIFCSETKAGLQQLEKEVKNLL